MQWCLEKRQLGLKEERLRGLGGDNGERSARPRRPSTPRPTDLVPALLPCRGGLGASVLARDPAIGALRKVSWFCFAPRVKVHAELIDRLEIGLSISVLISRCVPFAIDGLGRGTGERAGHFRSAKRMSNFSMEKFHKKNKKRVLGDGAREKRKTASAQFTRAGTAPERERVRRT